MNKKSKLRILFAVFMCAVAVIFSSCATNKQIDGDSIFSGMIVDEMNQPVEGFPVSLFMGNKNYGICLTNESGIFAFRNVKCGEVLISGKKEGYSILKSSETFLQRDKIFCYQILSVDAALDKVDEKILQDDFDGAKNLLELIYAKDGSAISDVVLAYKEFLGGEL